MTLALDALGSPVRRHMLALLRAQPRAVGALTLALERDLSRPAVSKHLRVLERAKLVEFERQGVRKLYRLRAAGFAEARASLDAFWDEGLARFKMIAEQSSEEHE